MTQHFFDLAFTQAVQSERVRRGSRGAYAAVPVARMDTHNTLGEREIAFIGVSDSFYLVSVLQTGSSHVQHRGGPAGFVRPLGENAIGWADYWGNRQYAPVGDTTTDDRMAMIFVDYPNRRRLKIFGHMKAYVAADRPDLVFRLAVDRATASTDGVAVVHVEAFDWNCLPHITPRLTLTEIEARVAPLHARIARLEAELASCAPTAMMDRGY